MVKWNIRLDKDDVDLTWVYENFHPMCITLKFHHSGRFTGFPGRKYINEIVDWVDKVEYEKISVHVLDEMVQKLLHPPEGLKVFYHFLIPGSDMDFGLRSLSTDEDILNMLKYVPAVRTVDVYIELGRALVPTYMIVSPARCTVVINEIEEDVPPVVNRRSNCKKKLFIEWNQGGETSVAGSKPFHELTNEAENVTQVEETNDVECVTQVEIVTEADCVTQPGVEGTNVGSKATEKASSADKGKQKIVDEGPVDLFEICDRFNPWEEDQSEAVHQEQADVGQEQADESGSVRVQVQDMEQTEFEEQTDVGHGVDVQEQADESGSGKHQQTDMDQSDVAEEDDEDGDSDSDDSDFHMEEADLVLDIEVDMQDFNENVDVNEEWMGTKTAGPEDTHEVEHVTDDAQPVEHEDFESAEEEGPGSAWKEKMKKARREHSRNVGNEAQSNFYLRQLFGAKAEIKSLLKKHAVETKRDLVIVKNDAERLRAVCRGVMKKAAEGDGPADLSGPIGLSDPNEVSGPKLPSGQPAGRKSKWRKADGESCPWVLLASKGGDDVSWTVKTYNPQHKCMKSREIGLATATYLAEKVQEHLAFNPTIPNLSLKTHLQNSLSIGVSIQKTARARHVSLPLECQLGILPAIANLFPCAEHRYCLRHVHENMKLHWKGKTYKDLIWKCATATTIPEFGLAMEEVKAFNEKCYEWLKDIPAHHWSRSHFTGRSHSDVLLNNICEVFNNQLKEGRDKPIISALEYVRTYLMRRIVNVQKVINASDGPLTPTATKLLDKIKEEANAYIVTWNGGIKYEVSGPWNDQRIVDVKANTCTCRRWELTGIPCKHVVATVWHMNSTRQRIVSPESFVHPVYYLSTWKEMYKYKLEPLNGRDMWPKSPCPTILLPPKHHKPIGRPTKKRRKSAEEIAETSARPTKIGRKGKSLRCSKCKKEGHNARTCNKK